MYKYEEVLLAPQLSWDRPKSHLCPQQDYLLCLYSQKCPGFDNKLYGHPQCKWGWHKNFPFSLLAVPSLAVRWVASLLPDSGPLQRGPPGDGSIPSPPSPGLGTGCCPVDTLWLSVQVQSWPQGLRCS